MVVALVAILQVSKASQIGFPFSFMGEARRLPNDEILVSMAVEGQASSSDWVFHLKGTPIFPSGVRDKRDTVDWEESPTYDSVDTFGPGPGQFVIPCRRLVDIDRVEVDGELDHFSSTEDRVSAVLPAGALKSRLIATSPRGLRVEFDPAKGGQQNVATIDRSSLNAASPHWIDLLYTLGPMAASSAPTKAEQESGLVADGLDFIGYPMHIDLQTVAGPICIPFLLSDQVATAALSITERYLHRTEPVSLVIPVQP